MSETTEAPDAAAPAGATGPDQETGGLFDLAETAEDQPDRARPADPAPARPAARPADVPEQFWDPEKGQLRSAELVKSWRDLRGKVSAGRGEVPETAEGYALPVLEDLPADLVAKDDPLWKAVSAKAHAAGVTQQQLQALAEPYLRGLAEARTSQSPEAQAEAVKATRQAELAKLGPNGLALVRDIGGWVNGLASRGSLTASEAAALRSVSTADGVRAIAKLRELTGHLPIPTQALDPDGMSQKDAETMLREGYGKSDQAMIDRARARLKTLEERGELLH